MGLKGIDPKSGETLNVDEKTDMTVGSGYQGGLTERSIIYQSTLKEVKNLSYHIAKKRGEAEKLNQHTRSIRKITTNKDIIGKCMWI